MYPSILIYYEKSRLSLCMIVKNEEENLDSCLKSVQTLVDEIIVIDTGSTDRNMEIARLYGAKIHVFLWNCDTARSYRENIKSKLEPCMNCNMQVVSV